MKVKVVFQVRKEGKDRFLVLGAEDETGLRYLRDVPISVGEYKWLKSAISGSIRNGGFSSAVQEFVIGYVSKEDFEGVGHVSIGQD